MDTFRRPRTWLLLFSLASLSAILVWRVLGSGPAPVAHRVAAAPKGTSVADELDRYRRNFRFNPDRRFEAALADVHRLISGRTPTQVGARWSESGWDLSVGDEPVGHVSPLPSFQELFAVLVDYARRGLSENGRLERRLARPHWPDDEFFPRGALPALSHLSVAWSGGARTAGTAERAAELLTGLLVQVESALQADEPLAARTLAALAVARALDDESVRSEESLAAFVLGYSSHAQALAAGGAIDPAVAAFVFQRNAELAAVAGHSGAGWRARYLHLMQLARKPDAEPWRRAALAWRVGPAEGVGVLGSALGSVGFGTREVPMLALRVAAQQWLGDAVPRDADDRWILGHSDDVLTAMRQAASAYDGVFVDREVAFAVDGALHLSALYSAMHFAEAVLASPPAERAILDALPRTENRPLADLRRWWAITVDWHEGVDTVERRHSIILDPAFVIGSAERGSLLGNRDWTPSVHGGDESARKLVFEFLATLDSRPEHREIAVPLVRNRLGDPAHADWLETNAARDDGPRSRLTWVAVLARHGGATALRAQIAPNSSEKSTLFYVLHQLSEERSKDDPEVARLFADLWGRSDLRSFVYKPYLRHLNARNDYARIEQVSREYLADPASEGGLARALATADLARSLRWQGRRKEAWATIQPELAGQTFAAFEQGVFALIDLDRYADAESLARAGLERYPREHELEVSIAKARWRAGRPEDAARAVTAPAASLNDDTFAREVAYQFWYAFLGRPDEAALEAFDALVRAISELARAPSRRSSRRTAARMSRSRCTRDLRA